MGSSTSQRVSAQGLKPGLLKELKRRSSTFTRTSTKLTQNSIMLTRNRKFDHADAKFNHGGAKFNSKNRGEIRGKEQGRILETLWRWRPAQAISEAL